MKSLEERVAAIEARNVRVEADKRWERSSVRHGMIAGLTYVVVACFMVSAGIARPFLSALVPAAGYVLSNLSLRQVRNWWDASKSQIALLYGDVHKDKP